MTILTLASCEEGVGGGGVTQTTQTEIEKILMSETFHKSDTGVYVELICVMHTQKYI